MARRTKAKRAEGDAPAERSGFAAAYPESAELDLLLAAFRAGNHRAVRDGAAKLAAQSEDEAVRRAARDLQSRLRPHPVSVYLLCISLVLLGVLVAHYLGHGP